MNIVFMGTPAFSVGPLKALVDQGHVIKAVYSQPPRRGGRGKALRLSPVHEWADQNGIAVRTPINMKDGTEAAFLEGLKVDIGVVVAYGLILPQTVLDAPTWGCLNIHASLLPRWRGAAPIQRAIMAGDDETGVCIMQMEAGLDTGPVRHSRKVPITSLDTFQTLHDQLSMEGSFAIEDVLSDLHAYPAVPQKDRGVTYAEKITKSEARIDWSSTASEIDRQIRGLSPFPGAWTMFGDERLKIHMSEVRNGSGQPGTILDNELTIATGNGAVGLKLVQRQGKSAGKASEVLRGFPMPPGSRLI